MSTENKPRNRHPKRPTRGPRTIGTSVGQAIVDAQNAALERKRREQAAIMRRMAGKG